MARRMAVAHNAIMPPAQSPAARDDYESLYRDFDSPLMRRIRSEAYDEDIGQHSWVRASDLRADVQRLRLVPSSRLLDLGCGACGPLTFVLAAAQCRGTGVDASPSALRAGQERGERLGVAPLLSVHEADLDTPLPFDARSFDAAMALDVVLHLRDRARFFREVATVLREGGRFLFTDAGVVTGAVSSDEVQRRSRYGRTEFVAPGWNERLLRSAGFRVVEVEDRTSSVIENAGGRLAAMTAHRAELEVALPVADLDDQHRYLETVVELARRGSISRFMYLADAAVTVSSSR
jgi:SAM-dependent methyltransferase